ncbi:hypothetical protein MNB_SV-15-853 [hydrothermal vent metagenome]|uniref:DUF5723 domain-containing protein n=1 Tax=hydrothermal vent metagenome TaxID=652676 RepID=A0A1W1EKC5_9ZZZZ
MNQYSKTLGVFILLISYLNSSIFSHYSKDNRYNFSIEYSDRNDAIPIFKRNGVWGDKYNPKSGENIALMNYRADIGVLFDTLYLGYAFRYDMFIKSDKSTLDIINLIKNRDDLPLNHKYSIYLEALGFSSDNLIVSKEFELINSNSTNLKVYGGFSIIRASKMQDGKIKAKADVVSKKEYDFDGLIDDYYYTNNRIYDLKVDDSIGYGYSLNFGLFYRYNKHSFLFLAEDFLSNIYWKDLPYSQVNITSNKKEYDSDGYIKYKPSVSGYELYKDYTQKLLPNLMLEYQYKYSSSINLGVGSQYFNGYLLPFVSIAYRESSNISYKLGYDIRFEQFSLELDIYDFKASLSTNDIYDPSALNINISYSF